MIVVHESHHEEFMRIVQELHHFKLYDTFERKLCYLHNYSSTWCDSAATRCTLAPDRLENWSFDFLMEKRDEFGNYFTWFHGGLVYHESDQSWGVHT